MSMFKKYIILFFSLFIMINCSLCFAKDKNTESDNLLYQHGLSMISVMDEMAANKTWISAFSKTDVFQNIISDMSKIEHKKVKSVYKINITEDINYYLIEPIEVKKLSEELRRYLLNILQDSVITDVSAFGGDDILFASSICSYEKNFVSRETKENVIFLYTFEKAVPVLISFVVGDNNTVSATASFILAKDFNIDNVQDVQKYFYDYSPQIEVLDLPKESTKIRKSVFN